ncbi:MAG TPA: hypothetical protein VGJ12_08210 [Gemmatimonadaceae bacterium]|jgi:hypothetical protein
MSSVLISAVVFALFFIAAALVGRRMAGRGRPYGMVTLSIHFALFVLVAAGAAATFYKLRLLNAGATLTTISLAVVGATLLANLVVGITMTLARGERRQLSRVHRTSTILMMLSIGASIAFMAAGL